MAILNIGSDSVKTDSFGMLVEELTSQAITQRRKHERRWYDNNFFDDGYHFRVISKETGRVIDTIGKLTGFVERSIPRASLQIRGVSNLLYSAEPYPVVYPKRVSMSEFMNVTGQLDQARYDQAMKQSKDAAHKQGIWLSNEWETQDLGIKLIDMILLAAKNSVSYMQVWTEDGKMKTKVFDAFDIICFGDKRDLKTLPFVTKTDQMNIEEAQTSDLFDPDMAKKLSADNKYATSEIKDAYMRARYGSKMGDKQQASIIIKETFMKEYLSEDNWKSVIKKSENESNLMDGKSRGDMVMRHGFSGAGITLKDEYIDYDEYPFAYLRFEPGPIYGVPFIERFIPQNKSLDVIMTRLEKWVNSMVVGIYQKRKDENFQVSNFPGGQMVEYEVTPLTQMQNSSVGATPFNVIELLNKYIDEQGATTAALSQLPQGVKSGNAIESLKSTDYANLKIPTLMLKKCIKQIAELMLERAHKDYMEPQEVEHLKDSEPYYFDVIGRRGYDLSQQVNKRLPQDVVPIDKDVKVRIEIEPGLGLTMDGKRQAMQQIITFMIQLKPLGVVNDEALKLIIKRFLETFGYGSTQEFMEILDQMPPQDVTEDAIQKMKVAMLEVMKDTGAVGPEADQKMVDTTKVGILEALKESGIVDKLNGPKAQPTDKISESMSYKDAPPSIQRQMEMKAGFQPASETPDQLAAVKGTIKNSINKPNVKSTIA